MRPFGRKKKFYSNQNDSGNEPSEREDSGKSPCDPLVRAFIRDYTPAMNQEDPDTINMTIPDLRRVFCAYQSPTGFDPLKKLLNQLDDNGFTMQTRNFKDEFVLPVRRATLLSDTGVRGISLPENN